MRVLLWSMTFFLSMSVEDAHVTQLSRRGEYWGPMLVWNGLADVSKVDVVLQLVGMVDSNC
ncbi:hypothetical protein PROFUN_00152 [Planoprotostelium fungivorum]|uniref:Uncharacterized protein n=1 Tax=Planoprotostelium fungivorum TaxID=1890364 RepID=A0A2P6P0T6_9EUKA|nr:hypothetical protein PROFUN_00152 [Planoprotostelium fungivorum]